MNSFEKYLDILPEIQQALDENKPVVALESTILSHGMPYPENLDFAHRVEEVIRSLGAIPATCAIVKGRLKVGLTAEELEIMCRAENIGKVSRRDVAVFNTFILYPPRCKSFPHSIKTVPFGSVTT